MNAKKKMLCCPTLWCRQEKLREAGEAEAAAKVVEAQAVMQAERLEARLHEAEVKATTALELAQQVGCCYGTVIVSWVQAHAQMLHKEAESGQSLHWSWHRRRVVSISENRNWI